MDAARELLQKHLKDPNNVTHSRESEVVLRAVAKYFREDEEAWAVAGLLHDLDWEETESNPSRHGLRTLEMIKEAGFEISEAVAHAISAHNEAYTKVKRESKLDYALAAGESVTGLVYAYALMRPEKLVDMKASSLNKKYKDTHFAAKVSRELIGDIEKIGLDHHEFFNLSIQAMQAIASEIGF